MKIPCQTFLVAVLRLKGFMGRRPVCTNKMLVQKFGSELLNVIRRSCERALGRTRMRLESAKSPAERSEHSDTQMDMLGNDSTAGVSIRTE